MRFFKKDSDEYSEDRSSDDISPDLEVGRLELAAATLKNTIRESKIAKAELEATIAKAKRQTRSL